MYRIGIIMVIGGGVLGYFGIQEYRVSSSASSTPLNVEIAKIHSGEKPANNFVVVGSHAGGYGEYAVFSYQQKTGDKGRPLPGASVNYCYYPIVPRDHPAVQKLADLIRKYGSAQKIPLEIPFPKIDDARVLVKTYRFKTVGQIPLAINKEPSIKGLIINDIASLDSEEERLVRQGMPGIDMSKVLILEEGRSPSSNLKSFGMIGGGALLILGGIGVFFAGFGRRR